MIAKKLIFIFGISLLIVIFLAPFASSSPDGLEKVAEELTFMDSAQDNYYEIMPDYQVSGINNSVISTILSGLMGVCITIGLSTGMMMLIKKKSKNKRQYKEV